MEFKELPEDVQVIAAEALRGMILSNEERCQKEPVTKLAHEVRDAFTALYSDEQLNAISVVVSEATKRVVNDIKNNLTDGS